MFRVLLICAAFAFPTIVSAEGVTAGQIHVEKPVITKSFSGARAAGGYMTIENTGSESDLLIGAKTDDFMAMIHESREEDGVMRMLHVDAIEIPAGGTVQFQRGGLHVMVMGLQPGDLPVGDEIEIVLIFDRAGEVPVTFGVVDGDVMDHSGHKMTH